MPMRTSEKDRTSSQSDDKGCLSIDDLSVDTEDLLSFSYQVAKGMEYITSKNVAVRILVCSYDMMLSCWSEDPLKRPSFRKLVERTELLLSENTKN
ncbi:unnamed protein product, partial [Coregonus sp. 'balchen']